VQIERERERDRGIEREIERILKKWAVKANHRRHFDRSAYA